MATPIDCGNLSAAPDVDSEGCPVRTKRRHVPAMKGVCGTVTWEMRLPGGNSADFAECLASIESASESESETEVEIPIKVRFGSCDGDAAIAEVDGEVVDAATGLIQFTLPTEVCQNAGIYQFQVALMSDDSPIFIDGGLISVERGLWGNWANTGGPPTIQEIRFAIKDRPEENVLLQAVEFDDAEILEAIRWPVFQFNETTPDLGYRYRCGNFPFKYYWIQAVVGRLLLMAVHHYVRNKMQTQSGGLTVDDKNKDLDYARIAKLYLDEWSEFVVLKKMELNASAAYGSYGSGYGSSYGWGY